jgi:hypothetical protein
MRLVNPGVETADGEGEVDRIEVIEKVAAKRETADGNGGC